MLINVIDVKQDRSEHPIWDIY